MICGRDADAQETEAVRAYIAQKAPFCELYPVDGGQAVFHYIFILE